MAGTTGPRLSAAEFERAKLSYLDTITQELQEAAGLMGQLDRNLSAWARRAGQPEALAQVWHRFQAQLASACAAPGSPPGYGLALTHRCREMGAPAAPPPINAASGLAPQPVSLLLAAPQAPRGGNNW